MRTLTGLPALLAGRAGVSVVTLRRWERTKHMPRWARILVALLLGELDAIDAAFKGWIIRHGELVSPEGWRFTPGEIRTIPLLYGQLDCSRLKVWALEGKPGAPPPYLGPSQLAALAKAAVLPARRQRMFFSRHSLASVRR